MLGKTSLSAIRALLLLAQKPPAEPWSPRRIAEELGESPTYMAKVVRHMVKSRILEAEKGAKGGVRLARRTHDITLLSVVEACQGAIVGDFCGSARPTTSCCSFHIAALELHSAITGVLARWTLAGLLENLHPSGCALDGDSCLIRAVPDARQSPSPRLTQLGGVA